jgi:hypothetical protein
MRKKETQRGGEKIKMYLNNDLGEEKGGWRWVWGGVLIRRVCKGY